MSEDYSFNPKRYTKKRYLLPDHEIKYLYKNYIFNDLVSDKIILGYDENITDNIYNIYPIHPRKLNFFRKFKFRKAIKNFIIYQYSIKARTYVERKILKESKSEVKYIYERQQHKHIIPFCLISPFLNPTIGIPILIAIIINYFKSYSGDFIFFRNYNEILMKYQINTYYKLGSDTKEFIDYLNSDPKQINKNNQKFDKFFVDDIFDIEFEKEDEMIDYLSRNIPINYHQEYLKILDNEAKKKLI